MKIENSILILMRFQKEFLNIPKKNKSMCKTIVFTW